jgi:hypothetical protein
VISPPSKAAMTVRGPKPEKSMGGDPVIELILFDIIEDSAPSDEEKPGPGRRCFAILSGVVQRRENPYTSGSLNPYTYG